MTRMLDYLKIIPEDARGLLLLGLATPLATIPVGANDFGRVLLVAGTGIVTFCCGWSIEGTARLRNEPRLVWPSIIVMNLAMFLTIASIYALLNLRLIGTSEVGVTDTFNIFLAIQYAMLTGAWAILAAIRRRWLARSISITCAIFSLATLLWFSVSNFEAYYSINWIHQLEQWMTSWSGITGYRVLDYLLKLIALGWLNHLAYRWIVEYMNGKHNGNSDYA